MRKRPGPEQIAKILREFQADLDSGLNINQACRKAGIGITTYYRWKALQENPISSEQLRVSELEAENGRLKLLVAELALDTRMLKEALKKGSSAEFVGAFGLWEASEVVQ
jgi:putative transposase